MVDVPKTAVKFVQQNKTDFFGFQYKFASGHALLIMISAGIELC